MINKKINLELDSLGRNVFSLFNLLGQFRRRAKKEGWTKKRDRRSYRRSNFRRL